jgi:catalase-peroxidase
MTDVDGMRWLEPRADGFRNWVKPNAKLSPETLLVDRAYMLELTAKEMTSCRRPARARAPTPAARSTASSPTRPGVLSQDFFRTLLDLGVQWSTSTDQEGVYEARDAAVRSCRTATAVDLVFGSNAILRGIAEVYSFDESKEKFVATSSTRGTRS